MIIEFLDTKGLFLKKIGEEVKFRLYGRVDGVGIIEEIDLENSLFWVSLTKIDCKELIVGDIVFVDFKEIV